jgi:hypothetical protein
MSFESSHLPVIAVSEIVSAGLIDPAEGIDRITRVGLTQINAEEMPLGFCSVAHRLLGLVLEEAPAEPVGCLVASDTQSDEIVTVVANDNPRKDLTTLALMKSVGQPWCNPNVPGKGVLLHFKGGELHDLQIPLIEPELARSDSIEEFAPQDIVGTALRTAQQWGARKIIKAAIKVKLYTPPVPAYLKPENRSHAMELISQELGQAFELACAVDSTGHARAQAA